MDYIISLQKLQRRRAENASPLCRRTCRRQKRGGAFDHIFSHSAMWSIRKQDAQKVAESKQIGVYIAIKYEK